MQSFKKTLRLLGLGILIVLSTLGLGISGAVLLSTNKKREEDNEIKTELVEIKDEQTMLTENKDLKQ